jgi:hypothetical protein
MMGFRDRVISLAKGGMRPHQIAKETNSKVDRVHSEIRAGRTAGIDIPYFRKTKPTVKHKAKSLNVTVPPRLYSMLQNHALAKGKTPAEIVVCAIERTLFEQEVPHD